ncbi:MAG: lysoplasmalogenase [Erysipelotrichaceae bacterium]|nr:lysoplasmalogenase [Erysipelotrichaceae bacterium]
MLQRIISIFVLGLYIVCSAIDVYASEHHGRRTCKVFLMPLLLGYYVLNANMVSTFLCAALVFGWIGDLCLMKDGKWPFVFGLTAFMIGHFCYIYVFTRDLLIYSIRPVYYLSLIPYLIYLALSMKHIVPHAGRKMRYPVMAYMVVLLVMSWTALLRCLASGGLPVWIGSLLFLISDTLIACRTFLKKGDRGIMLTYVLAQFLIISGFIS